MIKFGILGIGKMGGSILNGVVNKNLYKKEEIAIYTASKEKREFYKNKGFNVCDNENDLFEKSPIIILAIKPQIYKDVFDKLNINDFKNKAICSLAPGKTIKYLESVFGDVTIVRVMPNTPAIIGSATTTLAYNVKNSYTQEIIKIFNSIGSVVILEENLIDEAIPLNGSMPAYLFAFAKSMIDCGLKHGLSYEQSKDLCFNAIIGSSKLALSSDESIDKLIDNVCSKGGATIEGIKKLEENDFDKIVEECYDACVKRGKELFNE